MNPPPTTRWRTLRRWLAGFLVCLTLITIFYAEENWRGEQAWEICKRELQAQGVKLDWADYIPAPVPESENVFGVPEMQNWFVTRMMTDGTVPNWQTALSGKLSYPGYGSNRTARLILAELTIGLPGASISSDSSAAVLRWGDPRAKGEADRLIKDALGPVIMDPVGRNFMLRSPEEIRPARILLRCQTAPTAKELLQFLPKPIANTTFPDSEKVQLEPAGDSSYKMTMLAPDTAAGFLNCSEQLEPEFALIRQALQRPYTRMDGNYSEPLGGPIPNFVSIRVVGQRLATMAQCHLVQGKPEEALRDLTLIHELCRIPEGSGPMTLRSAMIKTALTGLYAGTMADGLRWHAWREPQLIALEEQLKPINLLSPCQQAVEMERVFDCHFLETTPPAEFFNVESPDYPRTNVWTTLKAFVLGGVIPRRWVAPILGKIIPRGWVYQNMAVAANFHSNSVVGLDPARQIIFPDKVNAASQEVRALSSHASPYTFMAARMVPDFSKAVQTCARNQTMVHQTLIVCALERYHLAHGEYPENLDDLAPQFLATIPHDVIGGQPLHYRRAAGGTFILYSVGWNARDDGGVPGKSNEDGDWVWSVFP